MAEFSPEEVGQTLALGALGVMQQDPSRTFRDALGFRGRGFLPWGQARKKALLVDLEVSALLVSIYLQACQDRIQRPKKLERLIRAFYEELERGLDPAGTRELLSTLGFQSLHEFYETRRAEYQVRDKVDNQQSYLTQGRHRLIANVFAIDPFSEDYFRLFIVANSFWITHFEAAQEVLDDILP